MGKNTLSFFLEELVFVLRVPARQFSPENILHFMRIDINKGWEEAD